MKAKTKFVAFLFCISDYLHKTSGVTQSAANDNFRSCDLQTENSELRNAAAHIFQAICRLQNQMIKMENSFVGKMENLNAQIEDMKAENAKLKTTLDELKSLPKSIEKQLQKYEAPGQQLNQSDNLTNSYPLLFQVVSKKIQFTAVAALKETVSCYEMNRELDISQNGVYELYPFHDKEKFTRKSKSAFCDMETDGGGWTIFQRRGIPSYLTVTDRSNLFNKTWNEYKNGFGDPHNDYWLGLEAIHQLTKDCNHELLITATHVNETFHQLLYSTFRVSSEEDKFKLTVGGYIKQNSTVMDYLTFHNEVNFSTIDRDNDNWKEGDCSNHFISNGFWFNWCYNVNLNGIYAHIDNPNDETMTTASVIGMVMWYKDTNLKFKRTEMKIRPKC